MTLKFSGMSKCGGFCHPMEEAYACAVVEHPEVEVYFGRANEAWNDRLAEFLEDVRNLPE